MLSATRCQKNENSTILLEDLHCQTSFQIVVFKKTFICYDG